MSEVNSQAGRPTLIKNEDFIRIWNENDNVPDVARALMAFSPDTFPNYDKTVQYANQRRYNLVHKQNIALKQYKRGMRKELMKNDILSDDIKDTLEALKKENKELSEKLARYEAAEMMKVS